MASALPEFWSVELIRVARKINGYMPRHTDKVSREALNDSELSAKGVKIAILGIAYEGGVDDTCGGSPRYIITELLSRVASVGVVDNYTNESFGAERASSLEEAVEDVDDIIIVTDYPEFRNLDLNVISRLVRRGY